MVRYLETFYRHRLLVIAPLALCLVISAGIVGLQPRVYAATAKIWVDRPLLTATAPSNIYQTPADEQTAVLQELVKTRSFGIESVQGRMLPGDLESAQLASAKDPISRALSIIPGRSSTAPYSQDQLDNLVFQTISQNTTVVASGPNIVTVTFQYGHAHVAADTVQGIINQYVAEVLQGQKDEASAAVTFYTGQLAAARTDLTASDNKVLAYLDAHPDQKLPTAIPDATLTQLKLDDEEQRTRYQTLQTKLDDAELQQAIVQQSSPNGFRLIDAPIPPTLPVSRVKLLLEGGGAGFGAGLMFSLLCLIGLTLVDTSIRSGQDVEGSVGYRLVGVVPKVG